MISVYDWDDENVLDFAGAGKLPDRVYWNGTLNGDEKAPDGVYRVRVTVWDLAGNSSMDENTVELRNTRPAIKIEPGEIEASANGEAEFLISAIERGTDWAAWATPNEQGKIEFNKHAFDFGYAWGLIVIVK